MRLRQLPILCSALQQPAKPEVRAAIEQTGSTLSGPMTLEQAQDDYLREIPLYTAIFNSVGLPKQ